MKEIGPNSTMREIVEEMMLLGGALSVNKLVFINPDGGDNLEFVLVAATGPVVPVVEQLMDNLMARLGASEGTERERIEYLVPPEGDPN